MVDIDEAAGTTVLRRTSPYRPPGFWRKWLIGRPLPTADAAHQTVGKTIGLAVFASDALSSTAYATQEILLILAVAGTAAFGYAFPIALSIVGLLAGAMAGVMYAKLGSSRPCRISSQVAPRSVERHRWPYGARFSQA